MSTDANEFWAPRCSHLRYGQPKLDMLNNVLRCERSANGMAALRAKFPDALADEMNLVLFSTSGISGSYCTIEQVEEWVRAGMPMDPESDEPIPTGPGEVTFLIIHPRQLVLMGGNCEPRTDDDFEFLKRLRASSWETLATIGLHREGLDG